MTRFLRGKPGGLLGFVGIAALVLGGLGWATKEALRLEDEQRLTTENALRLEEEKRLAAENAFRLEEEKRIGVEAARTADQIRMALWRLDTRLMPALAREDSRPFTHYVALHSPFGVLTGTGEATKPGQFYLPSPLMTAELPDWMILHFQVDPVNGWMSPQVIPDSMKKLLRKQPLELNIDNVNDARVIELAKLKSCYPASIFLKSLKDRGMSFTELNLPELNFNYLNNFQGQGTNDTKNGFGTGRGAPNNSITPAQGLELLDPLRRSQMTNRAKIEGQWTFWNEGRHFEPLENTYPTKTVSTPQPIEVRLGSMRPLWLPNAQKPERLLMLRPAQVGNKAVFQGILLDWTRVSEILKEEVADLFPDAKLIPLSEGEPPHPERSMTALPIELDTGIPVMEPTPESNTEPASASVSTGTLGWTPLRIGLGFAWIAVTIALLAVGLGGWSLLDLSERRIRFVSAVTHELRTPLTTLRLYLDLLTSGLISEETQKAEYLRTLNCEAERLNRLIDNVLDFARLEKSRPTIERRPVAVADLLEQLRNVWHERCAAASKDLVSENRLPTGTTLCTDGNLLEQILGNLIDNARKYSQDAVDPHIYVRVRSEGSMVQFEVEDRGPGVTKLERGSIFRPFRRGRGADVKAGGVGLGLALATRWTHLLGGKLTVRPGANGIGACFRLELPQGASVAAT